MQKEPPDPSPFRLSIDRRTVVATLSIVVATLLLVHIGLTVYHYTVSELPWLLRQLFDVDEENNIPTWYSSAALLLTSFVLALQTAGSRRRADGLSVYWAGLTAGFLLLSLDEMAGLHETLNTITEASWAWYALAPVGLLLLLYLRFLTRLPRRTALGFLTGGLLFVGGAVGVELYTEPYAEFDALDTLAYNLWTPIEEGMEMFGVIVFLQYLSSYMAQGRREFSLTLTTR